MQKNGKLTKKSPKAGTVSKLEIKDKANGPKKGK